MYIVTTVEYKDNTDNRCTLVTTVEYKDNTDNRLTFAMAFYRPSGVPDNTFVCTRLSPERQHRLISYGSKFCVFLLYAHWKQSWKKRSSCISRYI